MAVATAAARPPLALVAPEPAVWDAFVAAHRHGHVLQSSRWGTLKGAFGWEPQRLALAGPDGLCAGAQVLIRRRFGLAALYVPRGPLLSGQPAVDRALLAALDGLARRQRAVFLRLEPNLPEAAAEAAALHSALLLYGANPVEPGQPRSTIHLDLAPGPQQVFAALSKGHRADVRRAARAGVTVREAANEADFASFFAIMQQTGVRAGFGIRSRAYYELAWRTFVPQAGCLLLAEQAGQAVATAMLLAWGSEASYLYSGSTEAGLKSGAQHAIQWHAIQWAAERGCQRYDFWGIPDALGQAAATDDPLERDRLEQAAAADPLIGVYRFKKGFGGVAVRYLPGYDRVYLPPLYALWRRRASF